MVFTSGLIQKYRSLQAVLHAPGHAGSLGTLIKYLLIAEKWHIMLLVTATSYSFLFAASSLYSIAMLLPVIIVFG